jgi:hypothetical protein
MDALGDCYKTIQKILETGEETFGVIKRVQKHRDFWKPRKVRVVLLAESHVYTTEEESDIHLNVSSIGLPNYPQNYVRLVYCLGYGETNLVGKEIYANAGTPQFWKIFFSCCHKIQSNIDFEPVLKKTTSFHDRLVNKIMLLKQLREMGIWLIDASIVSLYKNPFITNTSIKQKIIKTCWDHYIRSLLISLKSKHIICIGMRVGKVLKQPICDLDIPFTIIEQPQAHLKSKKHIQNYHRYYEICTKNCR